MKHFGIDVVVHGSTTIYDDEHGNDPYILPKKLNKFETVLTGNDMNTDNIIDRIIQNRYGIICYLIGTDHIG